MKIRLRHRTTYRYSEPVAFGQHKIRTRPRDGHDVHIESSLLEISPDHTIRWMRDVNGNSVARVDFPGKAARLSFFSEVVLNQYDSNPLDFLLDPNAVYYPFVYGPDCERELASFITTIYPKDTARLRAWLAQFWKAGDRVETIVLLQRVNMHINHSFQCLPSLDEEVQTPGETLQKNSGTSRDFAALLLEACRCWGLAARFVSGYVHCDSTEAGGAPPHAWTEIYLPGAGWKGFDPTAGIMTGAQYVAVAVSRLPENAAPISGSYTGPANAFESVEIEVTITRIDLPRAVTPVASSIPGNQNQSRTQQ